MGLVLEPLTYDQAKQLGPEVLGHCFTNRQTIQELVDEVAVKVAEDEQMLIARMAQDVEENARLRHVRIKKIRIQKRDLSGDGLEKRKSKKIAPQQATLRATLECLVDSSEQVHREFLCKFFARTMFFTFEPEQENLFTGVYSDDDDDRPKQLDLDEEDREVRPPKDDEAGDVLDEQGAGGKKKKGGRKRADS